MPKNMFTALIVLASKVELSQANGFPFDRASDSVFMAQKLLIHDRRERRSRANDILYLHDSIELFGAWLDVLTEQWKLAAKAALSEGAVRSIAAYRSWGSTHRTPFRRSEPQFSILSR
jgi:hypothetical protein